MQRNTIDWKVWLLIWGIGSVSSLALIPYLIDLLGEPLRQAAAKSGISLSTLVAMQIAQGIVLLGVCGRIGIWAARRLGLSFPIFDAVVAKESVPFRARPAFIAALLGFVAGGLVFLTDAFVFRPPKSIALNGIQRWGWEGLLASFYGGISEEVLFRLFLLSLFGLALRRIFSGPMPRGTPLTPAVFWTANILAAVAFGLGHLPATAALVPVTTLLVIRAVVLNGSLGLMFGELYRRWGLEMSILAHFSSDVALHVISPLVK